MWNVHTDRELVHAARYLLGLALVPDIAKEHKSHGKHWRRTSLPLPPGVADPLETFGPNEVDPSAMQALGVDSGDGGSVVSTTEAIVGSAMEQDGAGVDAEAPPDPPPTDAKLPEQPAKEDDDPMSG